MNASAGTPIPVTLRTYRNRVRGDPLSKHFKIWEACRATSAATTFFNEFRLSYRGITQRFVDGGLALNNPVELVLQESIDLWGARDSLLLSIGTGTTTKPSFEGSLPTVARLLKDLVTQTERTALMFYNQHEAKFDDGFYARLNAPGVGDIGLEEHKEFETVLARTLDYLNGPNGGGTMRRFVRNASENGNCNSLRYFADSDLPTLPEACFQPTFF
ncbi:hypothetical protein ABW19_dt0209023 [Dactylella cylindrospora]|nr:hypothetical protein ABW19_dt0209023 [Dactylella cylindrospora]